MRITRHERITADAEILCIGFVPSEYRSQAILCAISSKDLTKNMVRVKSSNVWAYGINIVDKKQKTGDVIAQFKGKNGGPGDIYILYDVPVILYRRWVAAPSKGHFYWKYLRNNFTYAKLTGDKKGKLKNAVNNGGQLPNRTGSSEGGTA